jgi:hypothetical protein
VQASTRHCPSADWIAPRLAPWDDEYTITIVVPAGFEAYARVLHPAETLANGDRLVRWADVAAWSGLPLRKDAQFHSIALPPAAPSEPPPYSSQGPQQGSLYLPDAEVLAGILRDWTATAEDCWFCVWAGFGWDTGGTVVAFTETGQPPEAPEPLVGRRSRLVRGQRNRPAVDLRRWPSRAYRCDPRRRQDRGTASRTERPGEPR